MSFKENVGHLIFFLDLEDRANLVWQKTVCEYIILLSGIDCLHQLLEVFLNMIAA
jgi:hypothetical protein